MNISIATVFKELYTPFLQTSLIKRAQDKGTVAINTFNLFDCVEAKQRIDAATFGPGSGMLIKPEVVECAVNQLENKYGPAYKLFFSPKGKKLTQPLLQTIVKNAQEKGHLMLLPARYEGMDARVEQKYADEVISVGDFVLMGGDIPAMMVLEGMMRLIPGVVGKQASVEHDSFMGPFVDYPEYTEPVDWHGMVVPEVIRSGNHAAIKEWRENAAAKDTVLNHFQWLKGHQTTPQERKQASQYIPPHYVALLHSDVLVGPERQPGTTSVTSIDMHDIARSSITYGIERFFIVTPLIDQQQIVNKFLSFWQTKQGEEYNPNRFRAMDLVRLQSSLDGVIKEIEDKEGKKPIIIATSARSGSESLLSYEEQGEIWRLNRPVLILFGTGSGLSEELLKRVDYTLQPIHGLTDFNHLSVRSAAAIILDRWLGVS